MRVREILECKVMEVKKLVTGKQPPHPEWPKELRNGKEIWDYIQLVSNEIQHRHDGLHSVLTNDPEGIYATLRWMNIDDIPHYGTGYKPDIKKIKRYLKMPMQSTPPVLFYGNDLIDGGHRLAVAEQRGETHIWAYEMDDR